MTTFMVFDPSIWKRYMIRYEGTEHGGGWFHCDGKCLEDALIEFENDARYFHHEGAKIKWVEETEKEDYTKKVRYYPVDGKFEKRTTWPEADI